MLNRTLSKLAVALILISPVACKKATTATDSEVKDENGQEEAATASNDKPQWEVVDSGMNFGGATVRIGRQICNELRDHLDIDADERFACTKKRNSPNEPLFHLKFHTVKAKSAVSEPDGGRKVKTMLRVNVTRPGSLLYKRGGVKSCDVLLRRGWYENYVDKTGRVVREGKTLYRKFNGQRQAFKAKIYYHVSVEKCVTDNSQVDVTKLAEKLLEASYECIGNGDAYMGTYNKETLEEDLFEAQAGMQDDGNDVEILGPGHKEFEEGDFLSATYCDNYNEMKAALVALSPHIVGGLVSSPDEDSGCEDSEYCSILEHTFFLKDGSSISIDLDQTS